MVYLLIVVTGILGIIFWCWFGYEVEYNNRGGKELVAALVFTAISLFVIFNQTVNISVGYGANSHHLPVHGVCEVLYIGEAITEPTILYPTLIKLPDGQYRLFNLDSKLELGLVKVLPDYQLSPFE